MTNDYIYILIFMRVNHSLSLSTEFVESIYYHEEVPLHRDGYEYYILLFSLGIIVIHHLLYRFGICPEPIGGGSDPGKIVFGRRSPMRWQNRSWMCESV